MSKDCLVVLVCLTSHAGGPRIKTQLLRAIKIVQYEFLSGETRDVNVNTLFCGFLSLSSFTISTLYVFNNVLSP